MGLERLSLAQLAASFGGDNQLAAGFEDTVRAATESTPGVITTEGALAADTATASAADSAASTADTATAAAAAAATTSPPAALAPLRVGKYHAAAPSAPPATFVIRERDGRAPDSQLREVGGISACAAGDVARAMALAEAGWVACVRARLRVRVYPSPVP